MAASIQTDTVPYPRNVYNFGSNTAKDNARPGASTTIKRAISVDVTSVTLLQGSLVKVNKGEGGKCGSMQPQTNREMLFKTKRAVSNEVNNLR